MLQTLDWIVLLSTLFFIFAYGIWLTRRVGNSENFLQGKHDLRWWTIGLSIMATQASAITFISTPGQAFSDGMKFVQFYFGLPIAMIFLVVFVLPIYYKLRVTTAYEYLEERFDLRMRTLTAVLFLIQRGVAAAISIYAPSIVLSLIFGWNLTLTNILMAVFVIIYTTTGGSSAVSRTQELQMGIIILGLLAAFGLVWKALPADVGLGEAWQIADATGKAKAVDFQWNMKERYNFWSGVLGATFLFLSYFGTDQSQVGRYLAGKSLQESRFGLLFNGIVKIPMQFLVLSVGLMVYVFYQFNPMPLHFNQSNRAAVKQTVFEQDFQKLERQQDSIFQLKKTVLENLTSALKNDDATAAAAAKSELKNLENGRAVLRKSAEKLIVQTDSLRKLDAATRGIAPPNKLDSNDKDFVFINFVLANLPAGLIGLIIAMIFCASWSTTASELSALSATTVSDIYKRSLVPGRSDAHYLSASRWATVGWGVFIIVFALNADLFENLIQAVNMIGSVFYGTILGIFFTAFFVKSVRGQAVFVASMITQATILYLFFFVSRDYYLWYNPLACGLVMGLSWLIEKVRG